MKFAISSEQRDYYQSHQAIEFEGLLTDVQLKQIQDSLAFLKNDPPDQQFAQGRDLWRHHSAVRKIISHARIASLIAELTEQQTLRLGYDEYLPIPNLLQGKGPYYLLLKETIPLVKNSSLQGVVCGLMLCIQGSGESHESGVFSSHPGHGVVVHPDFPIPYGELFQRRGHAYLLIVYTKPNAVYIHQTEDPHSLAFKNIGYSLGDKLKDKWNPIIFRG